METADTYLPGGYRSSNRLERHGPGHGPHPEPGVRSCDIDARIPILIRRGEVRAALQPPRCGFEVLQCAYLVLPQDLASASTTANYTFITPNLCSDGHDVQCIDGRSGGLTAIDLFLRRWVPLIEAAPAFMADGMLIITFDESDGAGAGGSSACCGE